MYLQNNLKLNQIVNVIDPMAICFESRGYVSEIDENSYGGVQYKIEMINGGNGCVVNNELYVLAWGDDPTYAIIREDAYVQPTEETYESGYDAYRISGW